MNMNEQIKAVSGEDISALFPPLRPNTHKGNMGRLLCVCGSYDPHGAAMCGAAYFSAAAAYAVGTGIVEIFTARKNYEALASLIPEAVFTLYDTEFELAMDITLSLCARLEAADAVVLGCGLGQGYISHSIAATVFKEINCPLLVDADGLNIVASDPSLWSYLSPEQCARTVITPHPGEMHRLTDMPVSEICTDIIGVAKRFAGDLGIVCLLKDHNTVITDGRTTFVNHSGNPGMASGGSGDVLSGIIGGLLARSTVAEHAECETAALPHALYRAAVGAYIHGLAGDLAAQKYGQYSTVASNILAQIPNVIVKYQ